VMYGLNSLAFARRETDEAEDGQPSFTYIRLDNIMRDPVSMTFLTYSLEFGKRGS
jgi:hypothetical protein